MRRAWPALLLALVAPALGAAESRPVRTKHTPIRDALDRVVERVVLAHIGPCQIAGSEGMPCFPVAIEQEGPRFSVAEALNRYRGEGSPAPGAPTVHEIQGQMASAPSGPPPSASGGVGLDPGCTAKNLWRKLTGNGRTYYLYRTWDARGERPLLTDHKIDPKDYAANLDFQYEFIGQFGSECAAVSAWNQALRESVERRPQAPEVQTPTEAPPETPR